MRVVVMTNAQQQEQLVLESLARKGIRPHAVVVLTTTALRDCFHSTHTSARLAELPQAGGRWIVRRLRFHLKQAKMCRLYSARVIASGPMNSARLLRDLRRLEPGLLILGGGGILAQPIIDTAGVGVLNTHPALLPWVRGNGVVGHSVQLGVAVGATCHYVDRLIDTGAIIERRLLPVTAPTTLKQLQERAGALANEILADVVAQALESGARPQATSQAERHPLHRWHRADATRAMAEMSRTQRPQQLFEAWKPLCLERENWTLPSTPIEPPKPPPISRQI